MYMKSLMNYIEFMVTYATYVISECANLINILSH